MSHLEFNRCSRVLRTGVRRCQHTWKGNVRTSWGLVNKHYEKVWFDARAFHSWSVDQLHRDLKPKLGCLCAIRRKDMTTVLWIQVLVNETICVQELHGQQPYWRPYWNVCLCSEIRECLKLHPDHKSCHDHYKKVKKLAQLLKAVGDMIGEQRWDDCISKLAQVQKVESQEPRFIQHINGHLCHCHAQVHCSDHVADQ